MVKYSYVEFVTFADEDGEWDSHVHDEFAEYLDALTIGITPMLDIVNVNIAASAGATFNIPLKVNDNLDFKGTAAFKFSVNVKIRYDVRLFSKNYFEFKFTTKNESTYSISAKIKTGTPSSYKDQFKKEVTLGTITIPILGIPGLATKVVTKVPFEWELSGGLSYVWKNDTEKGFNYNTKTGRQDIDKKNNSSNFEITGEIKFTFGAKLEFILSFLGKTVEAGISLHAGIEVKGSTKIQVTGERAHICYVCIDGNCSFFLKASLFLKVDLLRFIKGTIVDVTLFEFRVKLNVFYFSVANPQASTFRGLPRFGIGTCTNGERIPDGEGTLRGEVKDAETGLSVSSAKVSVYRNTSLVGSKNVNSSGSYEFTLPSGRYKVVIEASNYRNFESYEDVERDRVSYLESYLLVTSQVGDGTVSGTIIDAVTGYALQGVQLDIRAGWNNMESGAVIGTYTTDSSGRYNITLPYGNYTITASQRDYIPVMINVVVTRTASVKNATLTPLMNDSVYRIVLTWGMYPSDLDSHLRASDMHVYYSRKYSSSYPAWLDRDDTSSYGPETITIEDLSALGGFNYMVHNYTDSYTTSGTNASRLSNSGATVRVYRGADLIRTYHVPTNNEGTVWHVFSMSASGVITDINAFWFQSDPSYVGMGLPIPSALSLFSAETFTTSGSSLYLEDTFRDAYLAGDLKDYEIVEIEQRLSLHESLMDEARILINSNYENAELLNKALEIVETLLYDLSVANEDLETAVIEMVLEMDKLRIYEEYELQEAA